MLRDYSPMEGTIANCRITPINFDQAMPFRTPEVIPVFSHITECSWINYYWAAAGKNLKTQHIRMGVAAVQPPMRPTVKGNISCILRPVVAHEKIPGTCKFL